MIKTTYRSVGPYYLTGVVYYFSMVSAAELRRQRIRQIRDLSTPRTRRLEQRNRIERNKVRAIYMRKLRAAARASVAQDPSLAGTTSATQVNPKASNDLPE